MATVQHETAKELLGLIVSAAITDTLLTYGEAAQKLGRPKNNARMVAQVCDLLDAAAAYAGVPLLALVTVRETSGEINRKAWSDQTSERRGKIIASSLRHKFNRDDFRAISQALVELDGKSNRAAWKFVRENIPDEELYRRIAEATPDEIAKLPEHLDAIDDIGTDTPARLISQMATYARDPKIREAVMQRASGRCEFCGELGFLRSDGTHYLECHHIVALASEGADRMTNVIALCANDHREAHFGERRNSLEQTMIRKVKAIEGAT